MDSPADKPGATVILPHVLRPKAGNRPSVTVTGSTIREIIAALEHDFPGFRFNLCHDNNINRQLVFCYA